MIVPEDQEIDFSQFSFLIVEDNSFMRSLLRGMVQAMGARKIEVAANGQDALEKCRHMWPDMIICDLEMAPISGLQLTKMIRAREGGDDVAIVMITGHAELKVVRRAKELGVTDFLAKPVSSSRMFDRLNGTARRLLDEREEKANAWSI